MPRLLSYSAHGGLTDQLRQLAIARALSEYLNRTLVLPPLLHHFDAAPHSARCDVAALHRRPKLSSLFNLDALGVPTLEAVLLPTPYVLGPRTLDMGKREMRTFEVDPLPAPKAIVLSIPHAYEAVAEAHRLVQAIEDEFDQYVSTSAFSTPSHSRCSTPPVVFDDDDMCCTPPAVFDDDDDKVEFVMERIGTGRGSADRPIVV